MSDRPIIFSAPMVRALLAGRKTQTRRLATSPVRRCEAGDRLYVREAVSCGGVFSDVVEVRYRAHERASHTEFVEQVPVANATSVLPSWPTYRPSIHMPRWASRLTLIVEGVKVEPLQAISWDDARAEGLDALSKDGKLVKYGLADRDGLPGNDDDGWHWQDWNVDPTAAFNRLWSGLHTKPDERWEDNPHVVALTFRVVRENIDRMAP